MAKKLSLLLAAAAVLAFAAPAMASAATGLTEKGVLIPIRSKVRATNIGSAVFTSTKTGNISCSIFRFTTEVTSNTTSTVAEIGVSGSSTASGCSVPSGATITFKNITVSQVDTTGGGTGSITFSFEAVIGSLTCKYSTASGSFTYNPAETAEGGDVLTFSSVPLSVTPAACGTTTQFDGKFTMETDTEAVVPVYLM
jgi:hypothetical protein